MKFEQSYVGRTLVRFRVLPGDAYLNGVLFIGRGDKKRKLLFFYYTSKSILHWHMHAFEAVTITHMD